MENDIIRRKLTLKVAQVRQEASLPTRDNGNKQNNSQQDYFILDTAERHAEVNGYHFLDR